MKCSDRKLTFIPVVGSWFVLYPVVDDHCIPIEVHETPVIAWEIDSWSTQGKESIDSNWVTIPKPVVFGHLSDEYAVLTPNGQIIGQYESFLSREELLIFFKEESEIRRTENLKRVGNKQS